MPSSGGSYLELQLGAQLQRARIVSRGDLSEVRVIRIGIDVLELCVVEGVEAFKTHLKFHPFSEGKRLERGEIEVYESRENNCILPRIAEALIRSSCPRGYRSRKGARVEPGEPRLRI